MLERHVWTISLVVSSGAMAAPPSLLETARKNTTLEERPALLQEAPGRMFGSRLNMEFGMTRIGEASRALQADGLLGEMAGDPLDPRPIEVEGIEGPVRMYEAEVAWQAAKAGPLRVSVLGGVRAYGLSSTWTGVPGAVVRLDDDGSEEIVPLAVFGGEMSFEVSDGWRLRGHAHGTGSSYIDLGAESAWSISPQVDLVAGYKFLDASVSGTTNSARLRSDGLYAQFKWRF